MTTQTNLAVEIYAYMLWSGRVQYRGDIITLWITEHYKSEIMGAIDYLVDNNLLIEVYSNSYLARSATDIAIIGNNQDASTRA